MSNAYYDVHLFICTNKREPKPGKPTGETRDCCFNRGGEQLREYAKRRLKELGLRTGRVNSAGCLDRCELGPVLVLYPEGAWYRADTPEDIDEILQSHAIGGVPVTRLLLPERGAPQTIARPEPTC